MKKLIVLATLAALPAVAMADVTISGNIGVALQNTKTGKAASANDLVSQEGDVLFSGSEDLGNGLKAYWKYDHFFNTDKVKLAANNGETVIGLSGSFGKVQFGATDNAAREIGSVGLADLPTVFGVHTTTSEGAVYKSSRKRLKDGITFVAPTVGGFTMAVSHGLKTEDNPASAEKEVRIGQVNGAPYTLTDADGKATTGALIAKTENEGKSHSTTIGAKFVANDMVTLAFAHDNVKKSTSNKSDKKTELNAALTFGDAGVNVGYAWNKDASTKKQNAVALSGSYAMGATTLIAGWYKQSDSKTSGVKAEDGYKNYTLGVNYDLSKRTHVGVEWGKEDRRGSDKDVRGIATYLWHSF